MSQQPDVPLDGLYGDVVMDHYRNPRNRAFLADADVEAEEFKERAEEKKILLNIFLQRQTTVISCFLQTKESATG